MRRNRPFTFYEFFAGGGMARLGLGEGWACLFANDFDPGKAAAYRANFPDAAQHFREGDVFALTAGDLPGRADLAWASSPCQDFSLAGARAGLEGGRSSAVFGFWSLIKALHDEDRAPRLIVIENVVGLLTSRGGRDFEDLCAALAQHGYGFGALEIDAAAFTPQSRPRLFVVAMKGAPPAAAVGESCLRTPRVIAARDRLPPGLASRWIDWATPDPPRGNRALADLLEPDRAVAWRSPAQTLALIAQMSPLHRARVEAARASGERRVGAVYRRVRREAGRRVQRAEVRFDGLAGCLRTPRGGSSRQLLVVIEAGEVRSRWLAAREGARLMGLPDDYRLPGAETAALHLVGDGVAVPAVRWLAANLLEPLLAPQPRLIAAE
ncbi:MAG: DNA cytosine methyltransferase [Caulobacteraceae bacterium]|nr:DNA cytosine methyltransferase [Caulobacteraceae bacterium]